jgi:NADPH:quinone reductase-like Zn-dependent oxidoreductase
MDLARSIGADHVVDYTREDFADGRRQSDVILDTAGNRSLSHLRRALTPRGTLVIVGGEEGGPWLAGLDRQLRAAMLSPFIGQTLVPFFATGRRGDLETLKELAEAGKVTPAMDKTFPLSEAPEAIRYLREGRARGKVAITI